MIPGADKILVEQFAAWVDAAKTEEERAARKKNMRALLFTDADAAEATRLQTIVKEVEDAEKRRPRARRTRRREARNELVPRKRRYTRATDEEGIGAEIEAMRAEARGTPFFTSLTSDGAQEQTKKILEHLKKLRGKEEAALPSAKTKTQL